MKRMNPFNRRMNDAHELGVLARIDLNLIVAFDALARDANVTAAATRLGVTQSAMSHRLRRLRELFGDPLLVRTRGGMALTPRAEALVVPVRSALSGVARALSDPGEFVPARAGRTFRIVAPDLFDALALAPMLELLRREAPGISLTMVPAPAHLPDALESAEVDLAISPTLLDGDRFDFEPRGGEDLRRRVLVREGFRVFLRPDHPVLTRARITLRAYATLAHVLVSPRGEGMGFVDRYLAEKGLSRRIVLRVPRFASALAVLRRSDLVLTGPAALAAVAPELESRPVPLALPEYAVTMMWHPRFTSDPAHRWLRDLIAKVVAKWSRRRPSTAA